MKNLDLNLVTLPLDLVAHLSNEIELHVKKLRDYDRCDPRFLDFIVVHRNRDDSIMSGQFNLYHGTFFEHNIRVEHFPSYQTHPTIPFEHNY